LIIKSIMYNLYPKIVIDDKQHMDKIMQTVFYHYNFQEDMLIKEKIALACDKHNLIGDN